MNNEKPNALKEVLLHKQRVSLKLSSIANDIAARGRRHDSSYTNDTELNIINRILKSKDDKEIKDLKSDLYAIHSQFNDYLPEYNDGIENMNMIQLLELIADKITVIDETYGTNDVNFYKEKIISSLEPLSKDMKGVIENTIEYFVDRNGSILKTLKTAISNDNKNYPMPNNITGGEK